MSLVGLTGRVGAYTFFIVFNTRDNEVELGRPLNFIFEWKAETQT